MSERKLDKIEDANNCSTCTAVATHGCTDAIQVDGGWNESPARFGCTEHRVTSNVILIDGTVIPFTEYHVN